MASPPVYKIVVKPSKNHENPTAKGKQLIAIFENDNGKLSGSFSKKTDDYNITLADWLRTGGLDEVTASAVAEKLRTTYFINFYENKPKEQADQAPDYGDIPF